MIKPVKLNLFIVILCFFYSLKFNAESFSYIQEEDKNLIDYTILYHRTTNSDSEKTITFKEFKTMPKSNSFGVVNGEYWFRLVINKSTEYKNFIAFIPTHNIAKIDIYEYKHNTLNYISSTGNNIKREQLPVNYKFPAFKINAKQKSTLYLKVNFPKEANFPLKIISEKEFVTFTSNKQVLNSFYYGTCIVIILLNLFFYIKFKDENYLYYLLFLSSLMFIFLLYDGSLVHLFRSNTFYFKIEFLIHLSAAIWFMLFSIKFLNLNSRHKFKTKLLYIFPIGITIFYIFYFATNNFTIAAIGDAFGITLLPILWLFGIYYLKQIPYAKFYVLGYLLLIPLAVFFMIGFPFGLWEVNGEMLIIKIASWLDMFVFTFALTFRMKNQNEKNINTIAFLQSTIQNSNGGINNRKSLTLTIPYHTLLKENNLSSKPLTLRELDILKAICEGLTNNQISELLFISKNTVKYHIRNIYTKINVNNRNELKNRVHVFDK
ncbi:LuxR C-terminal-related transcriptional regulator [Polaribacter sp. Hel1_85]|uniref:LuxR C-terminal-related transcriptional regulator n=1 Tax=Polaribacter sp. Hel1_85 TaxID=1250005 RepID=UPI00052CD834|nr:LuxR C-terminal-related transcriptional regulator [Polaribacter sp. Hel1_85]KGL62954.1 transcriptional regulator, LuxR/FixJ family [Polaribacter sp. Hel1_85]